MCGQILRNVEKANSTIEAGLVCTPCVDSSGKGRTFSVASGDLAAVHGGAAVTQLADDCFESLVKIGDGGKYARGVLDEWWRADRAGRLEGKRIEAHAMCFGPEDKRASQ